MHLLRHISELQRFKGPMSMAIGVFDGVHLGHQSVIREAARRAHALDGVAAVLTFHPHPAKILRPGSAPPLLTTEQQDYELFSTLGVDICVIADFTEQLHRQPPQQFLDDLRKAAPNLEAIVVGPSWHFGYKRHGNYEFLKTWGAGHHCKAVEMPPVTVRGEVVSSTAIRRHVSGGDVRQAMAKLGRPYQLVGRVIHGNKVGRKLGFPTANLEVESELIPANGVYAARALMEGLVLPAAVNIGTRPTLGKSKAVWVEAHLLEFADDLYGEPMRLDFLERLRDEKTFKSLRELQEQIERDCERTVYLAYGLVSTDHDHAAED